MEFITEDGYEIKPGMEEEYQQWVIDHKDEIHRAVPTGVEFIGTYVLVYGSDYSGGSWRDLYRLDSYAALDRLAAEGKDPDSALGRLQRDSIRFLDLSRSPERWTRNLTKNVVDATVINTVPDEAREAVGAGR